MLNLMSLRFKNACAGQALCLIKDLIFVNNLIISFINGSLSEY